MNRFLKEIHEQPEALKDTLSFYLSDAGGDVLDNLASAVHAKGIEKVVFTGMGSSYFVSYAAAILTGSAGVHAVAANAGELLHYGYPVVDEKTLLVCISQSGESYEIKKLLEKRDANVLCAGITNEKDSTLGRKADIVLLTKAGVEQMTSTKTYITTQLAAFFAGWKIAGLWNDVQADKLMRLPVLFADALNALPEQVEKALDFLGELNAIPVIARGPSYSTASQSALMFKEADKVPAFSILGGEFRHGPMEMVQPGVKVVLFAPLGKTFDQSMKMAKDIAGFGGKVVLVTDADVDPADGKIFTIKVSGGDEFLFTITAILPLQLMVDAYAKRCGFKAGSFSHGAKVTEIE